MLTEKELVLLAQQGNQDAFCELYKKYDLKIEAFIYSRINNLNEAEDVVSHVWEKVVINLPNLNANYEYSFCLWIFTITKNTLKDYYRSKNKQQEVVSLDDILESCIGQNPEIKDFFEHEHLLKIIEKLPPQQKTTIKLKFFQHFQNKEIAQKLKLSEKTVAANLSRALKKLLKLMQ